MSLPFHRSLGFEHRYTGRGEITALVHKLLEIYPNFAFSPDDTRILIETPDKTFAEYVGSWARRGDPANGSSSVHRVPGGRGWQDQVAAESFNPMTMTQAQLPNGIADIGRHGDQVHSSDRAQNAVCTETLMQPGPKDGLLLHQLSFALSANRKE